MPALEPPRRLQNHHARIGVASSPLMWLMALAFMAAGAFTIGMALGPWVPEHELDAPRWVVAMIGLIFFCPGMLMALSMIRLRKPVHNAPLWDKHRRWPRDRLSDEAPRDLRLHLLWAAGLLVFLTPFNYFQWQAIERGRWASPEVFGIGLFDGVLLIMLLHAAYKMLRWWRHGRSRLELGSFPLPLGRTVQMRLLGPDTLQSGMLLQATLMAIESRWEESGTARNKRQSVASYCLYEEKQTITLHQIGECRLEWQLPEQPETRLGDFPACYWELHLRASRPGIDYHSTFLLPVYLC